MGASLNQNLDALFSKLENFVSTKTVVGEPVFFGDVVIVPLVDVSVGVGAGNMENDKKEGGAGGLGAKITPSAVIVVVNNTVQLVNVKNQDSVNKLIDLVPGIAAKLGSLFGKKDGKDAKNAESTVSVTE